MTQRDLTRIAHEEIQADDDQNIQGSHVEYHEVVIVPQEGREGENDGRKNKEVNLIFLSHLETF
jgi:hypothetical protein